ncbi:SusC/RagA family TonB-linked outer membrane protein [Algibacter sp. L4_22]|uniref:SusC/RagA family TonB-linked outer membrane protein n=1 Tax=Algibacter sp. L4_22 TaxID=2942477 RepID=UPI00201B83BE|nr:SusC/RagA family TonB-linked outer membrane protein [Algibacter sp. L4_22]MCL5129258.1 SusC/RagA family TonB-linked outer membrane protein [Algibacter sp. L4_22]
MFTITLAAQDNDRTTTTDSVEISANNLVSKISEEVNVGFQNRKTIDVVGAVSTIEPDDFLKYDNTQWVRDALSGRILGLKGSDNIRGLGTALIVVDGIPGRSIDLLNMEEIQEITILKDANAVALYGAMGKNGVIVVTTKRGTEKQEFNVSVSSGIKFPTSVPNYLGSAEYMTLFNEARTNDGLLPSFTDETIANHASGVNPYRYPNVDLYSSDYMKDFASFTNVVADFSGAVNDTKYYINIGFKIDQTIQDVTDNDKGVKRFNVRGNIDFRVNDWIKSSFDMIAIIEQNKTSLTNLYDAGNSFRPDLYAPLLPISAIDVTDNPELAGVLQAAKKFDGFLIGGNQNFKDNVPLGNVYAGGNRTDVTRISQVNNAIDFDLSAITEGLSAKTYLSFDFYNIYNTSNVNQFAAYEPTWNVDNKIVGLENIRDNDVAGLTENISSNLFTIRYGFYGMINYEKMLGENHKINTSLIALANSTQVLDEEQSSKNSHLGMSVNYTYKNKLMFDFNASYVNSIKLAEGNRGKFAPTLGFAYVLTEEASLKDSSWLNYLKLRSSMGVVYSDLGIDGYFLYDAIYQQDGGSFNWGDASGSGFNNQYTTISRGQNNNLGMEKRMDYNLGFEALIAKKLWVEASVFRSDLTDQVINATTVYPEYYGGFRPYSNFNADKYSGFEFGANYLDRFGEFGINIGARVLYTNSTRKKVDEVYADEYQNREGKPVNAIFGLESMGFFGEDDFNTDGSLKSGIPLQFGALQPGDLRYSDINNDGVVNDQDQVSIGRYDSPWTFSSDITLDYGSFTLFALLTAEVGGDGVADGSYYRPEGDQKYSEVVRGRWTPETANTATFPRLSSLPNTNNLGKNSTFWLYDNSNLRLQRVQLTYDLPRNWVDKMNMDDFSVYASGSNLAEISKNKDIRNLQLNNSPLYRYYSLGLRMKF